MRHAKATSRQQLLDKAKARGVPERYRRVYEEFLRSPEPYDLRAELALQRTLVVEARERLDQQSEEKQRKLCQRIRDALCEKLSGKANPEKLSRLLDLIEEVVAEEVSSVFPTFLSMQNFKDLSYILRQVVETAERMKKIQEGIKLDVSLDTETLIQWLKFVVFPFVTDPVARSQMVQRAASFRFHKATAELEAEVVPTTEEKKHPALGHLSLPKPAPLLDTVDADTREEE